MAVLTSVDFYRRTFRRKEAEFNRESPLPAYFGPLIGDKTSVMIAELGAGPINTIGTSWPGVTVHIAASDKRAADYAELWRTHGKTPIVPVLYQNMERLTYARNLFDIVHCRNAVDHTRDASSAIAEMQRICKPGGYVHLRHAPGQKTRYGGNHYWDWETVDLPDFKTTRDGELIVQTWRKPL